MKGRGGSGPPGTAFAWRGGGDGRWFEAAAEVRPYEEENTKGVYDKGLLKHEMGGIRGLRQYSVCWKGSAGSCCSSVCLKASQSYFVEGMGRTCVYQSCRKVNVEDLVEASPSVSNISCT